MTYSKLTSKYVPVGKYNDRAGTSVRKLTPHYMAGNVGGEQCALSHRNSGAQASANYYIGSDGKIVCGVPEECRAWTSFSPENDYQAITFECANIDANGTLTDACYSALVRLSADICQRYGINPRYDGTPNGTITVHRMFVATSCPGQWLMDKIQSGQYERDVKAAMNKPKPTAKPAPSVKDGGKGAVYRLANPNNGDRLYTLNLAEARNVQKSGWNFEFVAWHAPEKGAPVYRMYDGKGKHYFTPDITEKNDLVNVGWKYEGVAFRSAGSNIVYRMYNPNSNRDVLTANKAEHDMLVKAGWVCDIQDIRF